MQRRLGVGLGVALTLLVGLSPAQAQISAETPPEELVLHIRRKPLDGDTPRAIQILLDGKEPGAVLGPVLDGLSKAKKVHGRAALVGAALAQGDRSALQEGWGFLSGDDDSLRYYTLLGLQYGEPVAEIHEKLGEVVAKAGGEAKPVANLVKASWDEKTRGSGVGTFLFLLVLCGVGGLGYVLTLVKDVDLLKGKVVKWTNSPPERDRILKELRAEEESPLPKLVTYLDKDMTSDEMAGLLDLISNFDEPLTHQKLKEFSSHQHDLVKGAAIQSMARLSGDQWVQELARFLEEGDETQSGFAAKALAERKAIEYLPRLQELHGTAQGATKDFYREAIERLTPKS